MKLEVGYDMYPLPQIGKLISVVGGGMGGVAELHVLLLITVEQMRAMKKKEPLLRGIPRYAAHI